MPARVKTDQRSQEIAEMMSKLQDVLGDEFTVIYKDRGNPVQVFILWPEHGEESAFSLIEWAMSVVEEARRSRTPHAPPRRLQ